MEIKTINDELLAELHEKAAANERLRMNFDLRTTSEDTSQRMLNVLEPGTKVVIHRHLKTSESFICLKGCLDWVFYEELPNMDAGGPIQDGEVAADESCFAETARFKPVRGQVPDRYIASLPPCHVERSRDISSRTSFGMIIVQ